MRWQRLVLGEAQSHDTPDNYATLRQVYLYLRLVLPKFEIRQEA